VPEYGRDLVGCFSNLALLHSKNGKLGESIAFLRQALEIGEPIVATRAGLLLAGEFVSTAQMNLAEGLIAAGDWDAARPVYERFLTLATRVVAEFPRVPKKSDELSIALYRLSQFDFQSGRLDEAERKSRRQLALREELLRDYPEMALLPPGMTWLARYGGSHRDLARILEAQGRVLEATSLYQQAISVLEDAVRRQPLDTAAPQWLADARASLAFAQWKLVALGPGYVGDPDRPNPVQHAPGKEKEDTAKQRSKP
jgi:tetratricopeptide (TPR) repeat protein